MRVETPWVCRRLGLLDSDQGLVGPWVIVERGFELCRWDVAEVAVQSGGVVCLVRAATSWLVLGEPDTPSVVR
jgi:hypothetical protein